MRDPVGAGGPGQVAALDLVLALRAGLDAQAAFDREVDGAVVAELEMQEGRVDDGAPVAAVERLSPQQVERAGDRLAILLRHHQHHLVAEPLAQQRPEVAREVGAAAPLLVGGRR